MCLTEWVYEYIPNKTSCKSCNLSLVTTLGGIILIEYNIETAWNAVIRILKSVQCKNPVHWVRKAEKSWFLNSIVMNIHCETMWVNEFENHLITEEDRRD